MIFESLWPLFFLAAVPVIILLYLLKPKGTDYLVSSTLLWKKLLKNEQSRTFFEKFVHNILMYLQILIIVLLVVALMSPFVQLGGHGGGRKILLIDTSASMQHVGASGRSRLAEAIEQACDYVRTAQDTRFSIVTADGTGAKLLAVDITDADSLVRTLQGIGCSDSGGNLTQAQATLDTLAGAVAVLGASDGINGTNGENAADLLVYTDGAGASAFPELHGSAEKELYVVGEVCANVANEYTAYTRREDGLYDVMVSITNYSDEEVSFDVSLYEDAQYDQKMIALSSMSLAPLESRICFFEAVDWRGRAVTSRIDKIVFSSGSSDSLARDNDSAAVKSRENLMQGLLVGDGNTFIEKAYLAVTGESITRAETDAAVAVNGADDILTPRTPLKEAGYNIVIYDAGQTPHADGTNRLVFGDAGGTLVETLENVVLDMTDCDLTAGLSGFTIGVNTAYCFALPEGARSFLEYDGKCVGYYRELDDRKEIVVGFDIRESDFPLRAEFPVFLANAMIYLSDTSWLVANTFYAGEEIVLQPWAEMDRSQFESHPGRAGVYTVGNDVYEEAYVVRFQTATESDGRIEAGLQELPRNSAGTVRQQKVKQTIRHLFIVLVLVLLVVEWIVYARQMRYRGKFYLAVRCVVFVCVLLAFFGIRIYKGSGRTATVFVVDLSNSNEAHVGEAEAYLQEMIAKMPAGNAYGIVTFGKDALVEQFLTSEHHYSGLLTLPEKAATNFEEAVSRALTLIPGEYGKRLVVLTDGRETRGDIRNMAQALVAGQAELLTVLYEDEETPDAYIDNVTLPAYLHPGDRYNITVQVESNYDTEAVIALYSGSSQTAANNVHLSKGSNRFVFGVQVRTDTDSGATENLRVQVQALGDTCQENDFFSAYAVVETPPGVLVISGRGVDTQGFASVLGAAGCNYSVVSARNAPDDINKMLEYKSVILVDTYIDDLPEGFLDNLETYVKDYGCGFVCCGGEDSFALGGYKDTVLETVLPVDMQLRGVNEMPTMAMVMVIDRSGSMTGSTGKYGISNLDIAVRAAEVAVDNLNHTDYVGVLTFDDQYEWQVALQEADDKAAIKDSIKQIADGGGTTIKPALQEAVKELSGCEASVRHIVLLTDGMGETDNFSDVIKSCASSGITLSTVAVGDSSDTKLLKRLADNCGGRYYYSDKSSDIPRIFAQEVFLWGDSYIQNGVFSLAVQQHHELTKNLFSDSWPVLYGYISATPKTASSSVIVSGEKGDPVLTVWQYGLGRTVAWTSDVTGEWTGAFAGQEDYVQLWKRVVDYSAGNANMGEDSVDVVTAGEQTQISYQTSDYDSATQILVTVMDPGGDVTEEKLHATAPGKYTAEIATPQTGLYHFNIRRTENGEIQNYMTTAAAVQFSDEYKFDVSTDAYLKFVQQYGRIITEQDTVWTRQAAAARERYPLTNWLLALAVFLFLAEVAMRRFQYVPGWIASPTGRAKRKKELSASDGSAVNGQQASGAAGGQQPDSAVDGQQANGAAQEPQQATRTSEMQAEQTTVGTKRQKRSGNQTKQKKSRQPEQTLDTSSLLRKKDDRNV